MNTDFQWRAENCSSTTEGTETTEKMQPLKTPRAAEDEEPATACYPQIMSLRAKRGNLMISADSQLRTGNGELSSFQDSSLHFRRRDATIRPRSRNEGAL